MKGRFFLDSNILIYTFDHTAPNKAKRASRLVRLALESGEGVISYQIAQEFFNFALRGLSPPMTTAEAEQYLTTVLRPLLAVHSSIAIYFEALRLAERYKLHWFDSLVVAAALESGCELLYTDDLQHGQKIESLRIENPFV
jgi:predicted nucleic acid-binding protein